MRKILLTGAGKIGALIACLLLESKDYEVTIADIQLTGSDISWLRESNLNLQTVMLDVNDDEKMQKYLKAHTFDAVVSALPYFCNKKIAAYAKAFGLHYFDLTEDVTVTKAIKEIARDAATAFVPQCGLAPGFIGLTAHSLMQHFDAVESVKMRVGALPQHVNNALHYALTWSTEGLINEYSNACHAIENGEECLMQPLQGLEEIQLDGLAYEAFNTSGGLGSLTELCVGKVKRMNYKTIRYPGHCLKMRVLMHDLKLNQDRETLKYILEKAIPKTYQDVVVIYVTVAGQKQDEYIEENFLKKIYPKTIANRHWSAIQVTTASGLCAILDLVLQNAKVYKGFVYQEKFSLEEVLKNRFGANFS